MYNVLIVENNLKTIENIVNNFSCYIKNIKIYSITSNYNIAKSIILSQNADIIILGTYFKKLEDFIKKNKIIKYNHSVITLSTNTNCYQDLITSVQKIIN